MLLYCNQTHPNSTYCLAIVSHFILIIWIIQGIDNNERTLNTEDVGVVRTTIRISNTLYGDKIRTSNHGSKPLNSAFPFLSSAIHSTYSI